MPVTPKNMDANCNPSMDQAGPMMEPQAPPAAMASQGVGRHGPKSGTRNHAAEMTKAHQDMSTGQNVMYPQTFGDEGGTDA